ncbi:MAG: hypothetical protein ISN28_05765 [Ectothiorhodospiraceae bacterium AqS1]|nr:hypothetical protein [Ectothiorhodospiraceae bacterium AqS1]
MQSLKKTTPDNAFDSNDGHLREKALLPIWGVLKTIRSLLLVVCSVPALFAPVLESFAQGASGTIQITPAGTLEMDEGDSVVLSIRLSDVPTGDVTVSVSKKETTSASRRDLLFGSNSLTASLTFTPSNYSTLQTVTVLAADDSDSEDETHTIIIAASGGINAPVVSKSVSVTDDDIVPTAKNIVFDQKTLTIVEGQSASLEMETSGGDWRLGDYIRFYYEVVGTCQAWAWVNGRERKVESWLISDLPTTFTIKTFHDGDKIDGTCTIEFNISDTGSERFDFELPFSIKIIDDDKPSGTIVVSASDPLTIDEEGSKKISVSLSAVPAANVTVALSKTNPDITLSSDSLTFTPSNYGRAQSLTLFAADDDDFADESDTIVLVASGGLSAPNLSLALTIVDNDSAPYSGGLVVSPSSLTIVEGEGSSFEVALDTLPSSKVTIDLSKTNPDLILTADSITITPSQWADGVEIEVFGIEDFDTVNDLDTIVFTLRPSHRQVHSLAVFITDDDSEPLKEPEKALALDIPPPESGDDMTLRIRCKQDSPCSVFFVCSAQGRSSVFEGALPDPIPAHGTRSFSSLDMARLVGWVPEMQDGRLERGRLGCSLHSVADIASQVWTRSGSGVLVNNSAIIRSAKIGNGFLADIESIPSPDSFDESTISIRCNFDQAHCSILRFFCYLDDGTIYEATFDGLAQGRTWHLQSQTLARRLGVRWQGLGLSCELRSTASFTAQVFTRTGGGGALINNSATGAP